MGRRQEIAYDRLVFATGAVPICPSIPGLDVPGIYCLHTMADSFTVNQHLTQDTPHSAIIIGGGYIGLEMADALALWGLRVALIQRGSSVLKTLDPPLSHLVRNELEAHEVRVITGQVVSGFERQGAQVRVSTSAGVMDTADLVLVAVGVQPDTALAHTRVESTWGSVAPSRSSAKWRPMWSSSTQLAIASKPGTARSSSPPICLWELLPINRGVSRGKTRWAGSAPLLGRSEHRW